MPTVTYATAFLETDLTLNSFTAGSQQFPDVLGLSNGGFVSAYNTNGNFDLLNFFDANGNVLGSYSIPYSPFASGVSDTTPQGQPSLTQLANGDVVVVWDDNDPSATGIRGAIFHPDGTAVTTDFLIGSSPSTFGTPTVSALANGNFVVAAEYNGNIFVNTCDPSGNTITFYTQANTADPGAAIDAQIVGLTGGGYAVTWTDTAGADQTIHARIYDATGTAISASDSVIASFGDNTQSSVAALQNGGFAVAYTDSGWLEGGTLGNGISLQYVGADGTLGSLLHVNTTTTGDETDPDVTVLANGFVVVSWTHVFTSSDHDIYAAVFDQGGNRISINGQNEFAIEADGQNEINSAISQLLNGHFVAGWENTSTTDVGGTVAEIVRTTVGDTTAEILNGDALHDIIHGNDGADVINGGSGQDELHGDGGNDTIQISQLQTAAGIIYDGGADTDTLLLSLAGTSYSYDLRDDTVTSFEALTFVDPGLDHAATVFLNAEQFGGGISLTSTITGVSFPDVTDTVNITMGSATSLNLSTLLINNFTGPNDKFVITGDADAETIVGTSVNDTINGGGGSDTMKGGIGNDTYWVDNAGDHVIEANGQGTDTVNSYVSFNLSGQELEILNLRGFASINGTGNSIANIIVGNSGNNVIDGLGGADTMKGAQGDDTYWVDNAGDHAIEANGQGTDTVNSTVSFNMGGSELENLNLRGPASINGTGNSIANVIVGNSGNNVIDGLGGADTMKGAQGNDTYWVDNAGDHVIEANGQGTDTVNSTVSFNMGGSELENLNLRGPASISGTGNSIANVIVGNSGANVLNGLGGGDTLNGAQGHDTLTGGSGNDRFVFNSAASAANSDVITDFAHVAGNTDTIELENAVYTHLAAGDLNAANLAIGHAALDANDYLVYNPASGNLAYDADGSGAGGTVLIANLADHVALTAADFFVI